MKKLLLFTSLTTLLVMVPVYGVCKDLNNEVPEVYCENCAHNKKIATIVKVLDKALEVELGRIAQQMPKDTDLDHVDLVQLDQLIKQELDAIKTKVTYAVQHDLTKEQRYILVKLLHNLKDLSIVIADGLLWVTERCLTDEFNRALNKAIKEHQQLMKAMENIHCSEFSIDVYKKFKNLNFDDDGLSNALKNFMCKCCYLKDLALRTTYDFDNNILLQRCFYYMSRRVAFPFVMIHEGYFLAGWQDELKKIGDLFVIVSTICSQLLETIEQ